MANGSKWLLTSACILSLHSLPPPLPPPILTINYCDLVTIVISTGFRTLIGNLPEKTSSLYTTRTQKKMKHPNNSWLNQGTSTDFGKYNMNSLTFLSFHSYLNKTALKCRTGADVDWKSDLLVFLFVVIIFTVQISQPLQRPLLVD